MPGIPNGNDSKESNESMEEKSEVVFTRNGDADSEDMDSEESGWGSSEPAYVCEGGRSYRVPRSVPPFFDSSRLF